jgi:CO/xanthine dehydrogenase Mo-binding subunit
MDGVAPAVGNAILDASLAGQNTEAQVDDNPATPERVWFEIQRSHKR